MWIRLVVAIDMCLDKIDGYVPMQFGNILCSRVFPWGSPQSQQQQQRTLSNV